MKVLVLEGGARKHGSTATVRSWIEQELTSMGHVVEVIGLHSKTIKGCLACGKCKEEPSRVACIQKDDAVEILEKMTEAELVLFTSPLYFWGLAGPLKSFIDRTFSLYVNYHQPDHFSLVKDQRQALLVTGGGPYENNVEATFTAFGRLQKPHMAKNAGELYIGRCKSPDDLAPETRQQAIEFARKIAA